MAGAHLLISSFTKMSWRTLSLLVLPFKIIIIIILPIEKHMQSKTMVLYPPCY